MKNKEMKLSDKNKTFAVEVRIFETKKLIKMEIVCDTCAKIFGILKNEFGLGLFTVTSLRRIA